MDDRTDFIFKAGDACRVSLELPSLFAPLSMFLAWQLYPSPRLGVSLGVRAGQAHHCVCGAHSSVGQRHSHCGEGCAGHEEWGPSTTWEEVPPLEGSLESEEDTSKLRPEGSVEQARV